MNESVSVASQPENTKRAEKYIFRYLNELRIHFNLSDAQLLQIMSSINRKLKKNPNNSTIWWKNLFKKRDYF